MPSGVYTERLLYGEGDSPTDALQVPEGKRIIVTHVLVSHDYTAILYAYLGVHGIWPWSAQQPATLLHGIAAEIKAVAYERETIEFLTSGSGVHFMLSGYVFDDPVGAPHWPDAPQQLPAPRPPAGFPVPPWSPGS